MSNAALGVTQASSGVRSTATSTTTPSILPLTALCFLSDPQILLAGTGSILTVYNCSSTSVLGRCQLFQDGTIHGIVCRKTETGYLALCWAGSSICAVNIDLLDGARRHIGPASALTDGAEAEQRLLCAGPVLECVDWILDCLFYPLHRHENQIKFVAFAVTAHNALLAFSLIDDAGSQGTRKPPILNQHQLTSSTRVLLYSAHVSLGANQDIFVSAGTAFGTVILWSYTEADCHDKRASIVTHHVFQAHDDGAVFGICTFADSRNSVLQCKEWLLATCSDDRTIKIWNYASRHSRSDGKQSTTETSQPTLEPKSGQDDINAPVLLLATAPPGDPKRRQGHISRIWKICSLPSSESTAHGPLLVSLGEDATCQIWGIRQLRERISNHTELQLSHIATHAAHTGKNLWSLAVLAEQGDSWKLATGGADGSIAINTVTIPESRNSHVHDAVSHVSSDMAGSYMISEPRSQYRSYSFIGNQELIATTCDGSVILGTMSSEHEAAPTETTLQWRQIGHSDNFKGYSLTTGDTSLRIGFIGGLNGEVNGVTGGVMFPCLKPDLRGKVGGLFLQKTTSSALSPQCDTFLVVTRLGLSEASILLMRSAIDEATGMPHCADSSKSYKGTIALEKDFVVTSIAHYQKSADSDMIFLGARDGRIAWYLISQSQVGALQSESTQQALLLRTKHIHADAVTSIKLHTETHGTSAAVCLLTTARDGNYACFQIASLGSAGATGTEISKFHQLGLPFGPYIEGQFIGKDNHICLYGFHGEDFVVYDEISKHELWRVPCGGAHRIWAFCPPSESEPAKFVFTRAASIHCAISAATGYQYVSSGGHGREIKACAVTSHRQGLGTSRKPRRLIATGGEDTDIRLWSCLDACTIGVQSQLYNLHIIKKHNTGVQQLRWSHRGQYLFSCGGREEFFVWKTSNLPIIDIGVACVAQLPVSSSGSDLRIMGFDVVDTNCDKGSAEHRINMTITMVLSNSSIRVYRYIDDHLQFPRGDSNRLEHISTVLPSDHCLTALSHLPPLEVSRGTDNNAITSPHAFITAGTDGAVEVWNHSSPQHSSPSGSQRLSTARLHQNAVKDIATVRLLSAGRESVCYLVITVGDDNAVGFTILRLDTPSQQVVGAEEATHPATSDDDVFDKHINRAALLMPNAHAASVTAIAVLSHYQSPVEGNGASGLVDKLRIVTASNDQRLKVWDITVDLSKRGTSGINVKLARNLASNVADASSLSVLPSVGGKEDGSRPGPGDEVDVLVVGVGMEVWQIGLSAEG